MRHYRRERIGLTVIVWTACVVLFGFSIYLEALHPYLGLVNSIGILLSFLVYITVGSYIAVRRPTNPIGWLFIIIGVTNFIGTAAAEYTVYRIFVHPGPISPLIAWTAGNVVTNIGWFLMPTFVLVLFPDGQLPGRWMRLLAWVNGVGLALMLLFIGLTPGPIDSVRMPGIMNPTGVAALGPFIDWAEYKFFTLMLLVMIVNVISLVYRFNRSRWEERLRYKWFAYSAIVLILMVSLGSLNNLVKIPIFDPAELILFPIAVGALPVSVGFAILRYRLYDIDILVRRTLIYGLLSALLALIYFGSVSLLQVVFHAFIPSNNNLELVLSTLAIAALFSPLRRAIQHVIDNRFYRHPYNAEDVMHLFNAHIRDAVDVNVIAGELNASVEQAIQPVDISLWLLPVSKT